MATSDKNNVTKRSDVNRAMTYQEGDANFQELKNVIDDVHGNEQVAQGLNQRVTQTESELDRRVIFVGSVQQMTELDSSEFPQGQQISVLDVGMFHWDGVDYLPQSVNIQSGSTFPNNPTENQLFIIPPDSLYFYTGTEWQILVSSDFLQSYVTDATFQADRSQAEADRAEAARDASIVNAETYADEATGREAVADGETFDVQGAGDIAVYRYRRTSGTNSTLIATFPSSRSASRTKLLPDLLKPEGVLAYDSFSRAAAALGDLDSGQDWSVVEGIVNINANQQASGSDGMAVADMGETDIDLTLSYDPPSSYGGNRAIVGFVDTGNFIGIRMDTDRIVMVDLFAGQVTTRSLPDVISLSEPHDLRVVLYQGSIRAYIDEVERMSVNLPEATVQALQGATQAGFLVDGGARMARLVARRAVPAGQGFIDPTVPEEGLLPKDVLAFDSFKRTTGAIGSPDVGAPWSVVEGTVTVDAAQQARGGSGTAVIDLGTLDVDVTFDYVTISAAGDSAMYVRYVDASNRMIIRLEETRFVVSSSHAGGGVSTYDFATPISLSEPHSVRCVIKGSILEVYLDGMREIYHGLNDQEQAPPGGGTAVGFYLRNASAISRFEARKSDPSLEENMRRVQRIVRASTYEAEIRDVCRTAERERDCAVTLEVTNLGLDQLPAVSDNFRGWLNAPNGYSLAIQRSSGFFVRRHPDGTYEQTTLGLTTTELDEMNMSGGCVAGPWFVLPPRDSNYFMLINWRTWEIETRTFGLDIASLGVDKWTGAIFIQGRYVLAFPTRANRFFIWDIYTDEAWFDTFGLDLSGQGKTWIGGCEGPDGCAYMVPFDNISTGHGFIKIDLLTMTAEELDYGTDLTGDSMWSGCITGPDGRIYACPRISDKGVLVIDPYNRTAEIKTYGLDFSADGDPNGTPGGGSRFVLAPNGKLLGIPAGKSRFLEVDTLQDTAQFTDFGTPIPFGERNHIGGLMVDGNTVISAPSSARVFLELKYAVSEPMPHRLYTCPLWNKGT